MRFFSSSILRISKAPVISDGNRLRPSVRSSCRGERGGVRESFDARLQLDERPELGEAGDAARAHLADLVGGLDLRPRIAGELLQPERDLLRGLVDAENLDRDCLARLARPARCRPRGTTPSRRHGADPATPAPRLTKAPNSRTDATRPVSTAPATIDSPDLGGAGALLLLDERAPRDDDVLAAFLVLDDPELVDAALRARPDRSLRRVSICENGQKARWRAIAHFVSALHRPLDLAFDRQTG